MHKKIIGNPTTTPMAMPDLDSKVDKVYGKGLSTNDFTDEYKNQVELNALNVGKASALADENSYHIGDLGGLNTENVDNLVGAINELHYGKVDKVEDYGLVYIDDHYDGVDFVSGAYDLRFAGVNTVAGKETITICTDYRIREMINPTPFTDIYSTLISNQQYNFGEVENLTLAFPTQAKDGDVIYLTFKSGTSPSTVTFPGCIRLFASTCAL